MTKLIVMVMLAAGCATGVPPRFPQTVPAAIHPAQFCGRDSVAEAPIFADDGDWWFVRIGLGDTSTYLHVRRPYLDEIQRYCGRYDETHELRLGRPPYWDRDRR